jgi:chaperone BCS1
MTSNQAAALDHALTRPGRIDLLVEFSLASREQIRQIYVRMYALPSISTITNAVALKSEEDCIKTKDQQSQELMNMAEIFAQHLPPSTFSPAEVQGFLLQHKDSPKCALQRVCEWRDKQVAMRDGDIRTSERVSVHHLGV